MTSSTCFSTERNHINLKQALTMKNIQKKTAAKKLPFFGKT